MLHLVCLGMRQGMANGGQNVSVVDPINNVVLGAPLYSWDAWPVNNPGPDRDDSKSAKTPEGTNMS